MKTLISFRLRKYVDDDLIKAISNDIDVANLCRDGLRHMLGIKNARQLEIVERPLIIPAAIESKPKPMPIPGKPAVFFPKKREG